MTGDRDLAHGHTGDAAYDTSGNPAVIERMPAIVGAFYTAFLAGDTAGVLAALDPAAVVRFPSYPPLAGRARIAEYFDFQSGVFRSVDFQLVAVLTDGALTAVVWREKGVLSDGTPWRCHGVDSLVCTPSGITHVEVGGPAWTLRDVLPRFTPTIGAPS
jgi:ketosteroid isomerase-like protein